MTPGAPSPGPKKSPLLVVAVACAALGLIAGCLIGFVACGFGSVADRARYVLFWKSMFFGVGIGLGIAAGFSALNWLVANLDKTKNSILE